MKFEIETPENKAEMPVRVRLELHNDIVFLCVNDIKVAAINAEGALERCDVLIKDAQSLLAAGIHMVKTPQADTIKLDDGYPRG